MSCCGGSCSCGKKEPKIVEESRHLVLVPAGGRMLPTFDWAKGPDYFRVEVEIVEVRFKNNRKAYYRNVGGLELAKDDRIVVEEGDGEDLGTVFLSGKAARKKFNPGVNNESRLNRVIRKATLRDLEKWLDAKKKEYVFLQELRKLAIREGWQLDISDVENRADGGKLGIYFASSKSMNTGRVAWRFEKILKVKVEMVRTGTFQQDAVEEHSLNSSDKPVQVEYN